MWLKHGCNLLVNSKHDHCWNGLGFFSDSSCQNGDYDDLEGEGHRILFDDDEEEIKK